MLLTRRVRLMVITAAVAAAAACGRSAPAPQTPAAATPSPGSAAGERRYLLERVDDAAVVQLYADGFSGLPLNDKLLTWHLYQAAIAGRDIYYDQRYRHGLEMREVLEQLLTHADGMEAPTLAELQRYTKLFWLNSGPYNNLTARKFVLQLTPQVFSAAVQRAAKRGAQFPAQPGETLDAMVARMQPLFFDAAYDPMVTSKTPPRGMDILQASANNLYAGVTMADLKGFRERYALNSRLVKDGGRLVEQVYRVGGRYDAEIRAIVSHLEAARAYAPPPMQTALDRLIQWYRTGEDADRRAYDIAWVNDKASPVDTINGFIEVYLDPRGVKAGWESLVFYVNRDKTRAIEQLAAQAQWFEDRIPWDPKYRKAGVTGITARAIDVVVETGDSGPITPVGINLPNDQTVREQHGSKSVSLSNVTEAYEKSTMASMRQEFAWDEAEAQRSAKWGALASDLVTNMHEVIGHASGRVSDNVKGNPATLIKEHFSALEEGRADLVALYFLADPKLAELGLFSAADQAEIVQAEYEAYTRNALVQLRRMRQGTQIEEDHMRNRQMVVRWLMANTRAIETRRRDGRTYFVMVDAQAFREGVARLLAEVQRIKAEGDYAGAATLFETHGIHFDPSLRDEVVARVDKLALPSYTGFVMPRLSPVTGPDGRITDVTVSYPMDLTAQMLEYSRSRPSRAGAQ